MARRSAHEFGARRVGEPPEDLAVGTGQGGTGGLLLVELRGDAVAIDARVWRRVAAPVLADVVREQGVLPILLGQGRRRQAQDDPAPWFVRLQDASIMDRQVRSLTAARDHGAERPVVPVVDPQQHELIDGELMLGRQHHVSEVEFSGHPMVSIPA